MPLRAEHPPVVAGPFDAFNDAVGSARDHAQTRRGLRNGLMVERIHGKPPSSERDRQARVVVGGDVVHAPIARPIAIMRKRAGMLGGNVLHERSPERHVRDLNTTTNREHGKSTHARGFHQRQFQGVAAVVDVTQRWMRTLAVEPRVYVLPSGEEEAVEALEQLVGVRRIEKREDVGARTGTSHRSGVRHIGPHAQDAANGFGRGGDGNGGQMSHWRTGLRGRARALYAKPLPPPSPALAVHAPSALSMFESFRQSLSDLMDRATPPEERRAGLARMKQTLVQAKMGLEDLRGGVVLTRQRLDAEGRELETMRRRKGLAAGINDAETLALAEKYEAHHAERAEVLRRKLEAQEAELAMVEREVGEMSTEFKRAVAVGGQSTSALGGAADAARAEADAVLDPGKGVADEIDALGRAGMRSAREAEAERQLAELKRRMGK